MEPRFLTTREVIDVLADTARSGALAESHLGSHPEDIVASMSVRLDGAASMLLALRDKQIVRWDQ